MMGIFTHSLKFLWTYFLSAMMKGANNSYFGSMAEAIKTTLTGFKLTFKHMKDAVTTKRRGTESASDQNYFKNQEGIVTLQYPKEQIPVPDNGRYKLHNEIDDCIVCDKCAKICPVNCIDIEAIKSTEAIGETSDGTVKRLYAAKFDIDMAKCCFCGLCTTVCPTECLTMTKDYDFSVFDINEMNFEFAVLTQAEADEKRKAYDEIQRIKKEKTLTSKKAAESESSSGEEPKTPGAKPVFRPKLKPKPAASAKPKTEGKSEDADSTAKKPVFRPKMKAVVKPNQEGETSKNSETGETPKPKFRPKIRPKIKSKDAAENETSENASEEVKAESAEKPKFRPKIRPKIKPKDAAENETSENASEEVKAESAGIPKFRPKIRPKIKPKDTPEDEAPENTSEEVKAESAGKPKFRPKIRPKIKPKTEEENPEAEKSANEESEAKDIKEEKPAFKPKMRPKIKPVIKKKDDGEQ